MSPEDRVKFENMERRINALERVENVQFIENATRRIGTGLRSDGELSASSITTSVRNAANDGTETVASVPDGKVKIFLSDGTIRFIAVYNS